MRVSPDPIDDAPRGLRRRLVRLAGAAGWVSFAAASAIGVYLVRLWLSPDAPAELLAAAVPGVVAPPSAAMRALAVAAMTLPALLFAVMLVEIGRLFRLFGAGRVFDGRVPVRLGRLGWLAFSGVVAGLVARPLVTLAMTSANPPGARQIVLGVGSDNLLGLVLGFLFLVLSLVMREALRLAEENASFV